MILTSSGKSRLPASAKLLATTKSGEKAYFIEPQLARRIAGGAIPEEARKAVSKNEEEWFPSVEDWGRLTAFLAGYPGAGKSFTAKELIKTLPPKTDIALFTGLTEDDGNFDEFKKRLFKIRMDPENLAQIDLEELRKRSKNPVLLFDDYDAIVDTATSKAVHALLKDALANGRGHKKHDGEGDIHVIATTHSLNDYLKTKYALENSDYVVVFPQGTTAAQMKRLFDKIGLGDDICRDVMEKGRSGQVRRVFIRKSVPLTLMSGNTIELL